MRNQWNSLPLILPIRFRLLKQLRRNPMLYENRHRQGKFKRPMMILSR
jgi:hypothetical protein